MAQIFRLDNPFLGRGLTLGQRLCYASAMLHFFYGLPRLIFLLSPLSFLLFKAQIFGALPVLVLSYGLPHLAHSLLTNSRLQRSYRHSFWSEVYETVLAVYVLIPTTVALIAPRKGKFNVTAKGGLVQRMFFSRRIAAPYVVLTLLNLTGAGVGIWYLVSGQLAVDVIVMNLAWTAYNLLILGATLAVAWETRQIREAPRVAVQLPAMLRLPSGHTIRCRTRDISTLGARLDLPHEQGLDKDAPVLLSIFTRTEERPLRGLVVENQGKTLRVRFDDLSHNEESWMVQAIFSRADAWITWKENRKPDFMPLALTNVAGHALRAFGRALVAPGRRQVAPVEKEPAP